MDSRAPLTRALRLSCVAIWMAGLAWLSGCSSGYAPVSERSLGGAPPVAKTASSRRAATVPSEHRVNPGDTLYSIAWRYGKDYRQLAATNGIGSDYRIYPGQRLRLSGPPARKAVTPPASRAASAPVSKPERTSATTVSKPRPTPASASRPAPSSSVPARKAAVSSAKLVWRWPVEGHLVGRFSPSGSLNKGIDIAAAQGDPVFAAATGRVVYAGGGLLGYGNLIIINHNEEYLSAYAHNRKLLVKEQDLVKAGDKIAEVGKSGTTRAMLHFEIRRDGKPVNPLRYLPKR